MTSAKRISLGFGASWIPISVPLHSIHASYVRSHYNSMVDLDVLLAERSHQFLRKKSPQAA